MRKGILDLDKVFDLYELTGRTPGDRKWKSDDRKLINDSIDLLTDKKFEKCTYPHNVSGKGINRTEDQGERHLDLDKTFAMLDKMFPEGKEMDALHFRMFLIRKLANEISPLPYEDYSWPKKNGLKKDGT